MSELQHHQSNKDTAALMALPAKCRSAVAKCWLVTSHLIKSANDIVVPIRNLMSHGLSEDDVNAMMNRIASPEMMRNYNFANQIIRDIYLTGYQIIETKKRDELNRKRRREFLGKLTDDQFARYLNNYSPEFRQKIVEERQIVIEQDQEIDSNGPNSPQVRRSQVKLMLESFLK